MISAYCILHYGKEWLQWSVRSVIPFVDEYHIFYTPTPSHGFPAIMPNPETRDELYMQVMGYINHGLFWHDCDHFQHEGFHREFAVDTCAARGADFVIVVDADEVWAPNVLQEAIRISKDIPVHSFRINMRHFWRSLKWVCDDPSCPTRIIRPNIYSDEAYLPGQVFHMGYAQSSGIIEYKMSIHGHHNEIRKNWFNNKFLSWKPGMTDVHPTNGDNFWEPVPYVDDGTLKSLVGDHPYWNVSLIA